MAFTEDFPKPSSLSLLQTLFPFWVSLLLFVSAPGNAQITPPSNSSRLTGLFPHLSFTEDTSIIFGNQNVRTFSNGSSASISLTKETGSGLASKNRYAYGFFSAAMKLPRGYTSGVVVAFYLSNSENHPRNHDEIDFELLGHENRKEWILQTNIYGNGSVNTGREEKFRLWFDPTAQFHEYSIVWNDHHVVFLVDNIPIREVSNTRAMSAYPSKPMTLYATIWDASDWATAGGKFPVDYKYSPFVASMGSLEMSGCVFSQNATSQTCPYPNKGKTGNSTSSGVDPVGGEAFVRLSEEQLQNLRSARKRYMVYSYCKDQRRYKVLPAECNDK